MGRVADLEKKLERTRSELKELTDRFEKLRYSLLKFKVLNYDMGRPGGYEPAMPTAKQPTKR